MEAGTRTLMNVQTDIPMVYDAFNGLFIVFGSTGGMSSGPCVCSTAPGCYDSLSVWVPAWTHTKRVGAYFKFVSVLRRFLRSRKQDYIGAQAEILKFHNTQESTLSILDHSLQRYPGPHFELQSLLNSNLPLRKITFASRIYTNLQTRIRNLQMQLANIHFDLLAASEQEDEELTGCLFPRQEEAQRLLATFQEDLCEFGGPPDS
ncbi:hypothetical protein BJ165DRAFT_1574925 [Panaeolus papilionaceus]|nr:hypothetical protein BJ165DRAFT_1574925 [Panaeolus papilionaceus]